MARRGGCLTDHKRCGFARPLRASRWSNRAGETGRPRGNRTPVRLDASPDTCRIHTNAAEQQAAKPVASRRGARLGFARNEAFGAAALDIHKARPVHNLREFLSEIVVIVIGVAIALTGEQAVEWLHWRSQVAEAEGVLGHELTETVGQGDERLVVSACVDRRLDLLSHTIAQAGASGRSPPLGDIGAPPVRTWTNGVWESSLSAQTLAHMAVERRSAYAVAYGFGAILGQINPRELDVWTQLYVLVGPGRPISQDELARLRTLVSQARTFNTIMVVNAIHVQQMADAFHFHIGRVFRKSFDHPASIYSICGPLGTVPAEYGGSPIAGAIERARASPVGRNRSGMPITGHAPLPAPAAAR